MIQRPDSLSLTSWSKSMGDKSFPTSAAGSRMRSSLVAESTAVMVIKAPKYAPVAQTIGLLVPTLRVQAVYDRQKANGKNPIPLEIRAVDAESNQPVPGRIF